MKKELSNFEYARSFYNLSCTVTPTRKVSIYALEGKEDQPHSREVVSIDMILRDLFISRQEDLDPTFSYKDPIIDEFMDSLSKEEKKKLVYEMVENYLRHSAEERHELVKILDYGRSTEIEKSPRRTDKPRRPRGRPRKQR